jgi:hypothetical protein
MNNQSLAEILPHMANNIEGLSDFKQVLPAGPKPSQGGIFSVRSDDIPVILAIRTPAQLMITAALAMDVPFTSTVWQHVNQLNAKTLRVGRVFVIEYEGDGAGFGAILLQEIVECEDLDSGPSINMLLRVLASVTGMGARLSPELGHAHGGQAPHPDDWLQIMNLA